MYYEVRDISIPHDKRRDLNNKCLAIAGGADPQGISKAEIAMAYSGEGGLHGLNYSDFSNYARYKEAKQERELGSFFSPFHICQYVMSILRPDMDDSIADLTVGKGSFINYCPVQKNFFGLDIDFNAIKIAKYLYPDANLVHGDLQYYSGEERFTMCCGNPPFIKKKKKNGCLLYLEKAISALQPGGILAVIVPLSFISDPFSDSGKEEFINKSLRHVVSIALPEDTFELTDDYMTKLMIFQKRSKSLPEMPYSYKVQPFMGSDEVYNQYMLPILAERKKLKARLYLEARESHGQRFMERAEKLLYDIGRNPKTKHSLCGSRDLLDQYLTQKKPDNISCDEWEKIRIKETDVISKLKTVLRSQNPKPYYSNRLVKYKGTLVYNDGDSWYDETNISELVSTGSDLYMDTPFRKLLRRKQRDFERETQSIDQVVPPEGLETFYDSLCLVNEEGEPIELNEIQKKDIGVCIAKNGCLLQWQQGCGKTLAGIVVGLWRLQKALVRNVIVVAPAIAIKTTWVDMLTLQQIPFVHVRTEQDIERICPGHFVLVTYDILSRRKRLFKRFVKQQNKKIQLIVDESDSLSCPESSRTRAVIDCFRRLRYVLQTTGTLTRNNVNEFFPLFELLYNNSYNMICNCESMWEMNKEKKLEKVVNMDYGKPFPPYKKGFALFSKCFSPEHVTVFGVSTSFQDMYNADILKQIIAQTTITRTLEEVAGRELYSIEQEIVEMNEAEKEIYRVAIEEFYKMESYFPKTGITKKDNLLKILNQLILMLRICAAASQFKEYSSFEQPEKITRTLSLLEKHRDERVCVGVRHIKVVAIYAAAIRNAFPDREVFVITGEMDIKSRKALIYGPYKSSKNAIIVCTQQSLSSSMNIDYVNVCIISELHWNLPAMSQHYFRFIRLTSKQHTKVYFVTYKNSIEENLLGLILSKEKMNLFMKGISSEANDLYQSFGLVPGMLEGMMRKEKDGNGNVHIRWGDQTVSA